MKQSLGYVKVNGRGVLRSVPQGNVRDRNEVTRTCNAKVFMAIGEMNSQGQMYYSCISVSIIGKN